MVIVATLHGDVQFVRSRGFRVVLITTSIPFPPGSYGLFSRGQVDIVIGEGALSGIRVRGLPLGPWSWRYPGGRGFRCVGWSVVKMRREMVVSRD